MERIKAYKETRLGIVCAITGTTIAMITCMAMFFPSYVFDPNEAPIFVVIAVLFPIGFGLIGAGGVFLRNTTS